MKFCDEKIQKHLLNGGKIKRANSRVSDMFNIEPVEDWTKSLIEVGK